MNLLLFVLHLLAELFVPRSARLRPALAPIARRAACSSGRRGVAREWLPWGWKLQGCPPPDTGGKALLNHALELPSLRLTRFRR